MKKRVLSFLLCIVLLAGVLPTGTFGFTAAAEEENLYKTEDVEVPAGWDYIEVHNREELYRALSSHAWWENNGNPQKVFIRLMNNIGMSSDEIGKDGCDLLYASVCSSTTLDFNGHTISGYIRAYDNGSNLCWDCLNIRLLYGSDPDFTFRLVDSVGGGGVSLDARTYVDGPTCAVNIHTTDLYWFVNEACKKDIPHPGALPSVQIDGGTYRLKTECNKWNNAWMHPFRIPANAEGDAIINYNATPYSRSAVSVQGQCKDLTVNDGYFFANNIHRDDNNATEFGNRYVSALGLSYTSAEKLHINGGLFESSGFAVYRNTESQDGKHSHPTYDHDPQINGGTFRGVLIDGKRTGGGIMFCSSRMTWWDNYQGEWVLDETCKDAPVGLMVDRNAKFYMDGKEKDVSKLDWEDIGWPHEIVVDGAARLKDFTCGRTQYLTGQSPMVFVQYTKQPASLEVQKRVVTIRNGKETVIWQKEAGASYLPVNTKSNYYRADIPARSTAGSDTYRVLANFGSYTVLTDEFTPEWFAVPDYAFTKQPVSRTTRSGYAVYIPFDYNFPDKLYSLNLYRLENGDHWKLAENRSYYDMGDDGFAVAITDPEVEGAESITYCIFLEYYTATSEKVTVYSDEFTVTWDYTNYIDTFTLPGTITAGAVLGEVFQSPDCGTITAQMWYHNGSTVPSATVAENGKYSALLLLKAKAGSAFTPGTVAAIFGEEVTPYTVAEDGKTAYFMTPAFTFTCDHAGNTNKAYAYDNQRHWLTCSVCGKPCEEQPHDYYITATLGDKVTQTCAVCGSQILTDNGKQCVDWLWVDTEPLAVGSSLPAVDLRDGYTDQATLTSYQWYEGSTPVAAGTVVESGKTYRLGVNCTANDGYYFPSDINVRGFDGTTDSVNVPAAQTSLSAVISFNPVEKTAADVNLPVMTPGKLMRDVLGEIGESAMEGEGVLYGVEVKFTFDGSSNAYYKNIYTDGWKNYSASIPIDTFKNMAVQPNTQYALEITLLINAEARYIDAANVYVLNRGLMDSVTVAADSKQLCKVTAVVTTGSDANIVDFINLSVDDPMPGNTPATDANSFGDYQADAVSWTGALANGNFNCETAYTVKITVSPANGAAFAAEVFAAVNGNPATVTVSGGKRVVSYTFPPEDHQYGMWEYVDDGYHARICAGNESHMIKEAHVWDEGTVLDPATCTEPGGKIYFCTVCFGEKTETLKATGHSWGAWTKYDETRHQRVCAKDKTHVEKANHTWDAGVVTKAATCKEAGVKTYTCTVCKATKTETIAKTANHTWDAGKVTKAATETAEGVKTYTCTVCSATKTEAIPKLTPAAQFILGDVDLNGKIEAADARLALRAAVGLETYAANSVQYKAADADKNKKLEAADARLILRAAVGLEQLS